MAHIDGRRARTERSRNAVIDAMIDLVQEGHHLVTADDVAERAQVSMSSLFRYFEGLQELHLATIDRYLTRYATAFEITDYCKGDLPARIASYVASRLALYQLIDPMARLVRARAFEHETLRDLLHRLRINHTHQAATHLELDPELAQVIALVTSFESWDQMTRDYLRTNPQVSVIWTRTLQSLLSNHELTGQVATEATALVRGSQ
jgi:TetR/AcrR family transcriptional regulator, regulator of autoinduction and epiphytic fitness